MNRKNMINVLLITLLVTSCINDPSNLVAPPEVHESAFATVLDSLRYALDLPALAGAIVTADKIVEAEAVGYRRYGGSIKVTNSDRFHLGSNTKAITAVLIGLLVDEGYLTWTTTLPEIFPEHDASMRTEYRSVTVRDLLSHTSGLVREPCSTPKAVAPREQRAELVASALTCPPAVQRGVFSYSNIGYDIAGAIAEKLTDRVFEELLIERVLHPLGITTAGFGAMGTPGAEDQPLQHTVHYAPIVPSPTSDNPPYHSPAGRLHMSIGDWAKYIQWVMAAEAGRVTLLQPETARMLTTPVVVVNDEFGVQYALGWLIDNPVWANGRRLVHDGSNGLNFSLASLAPSLGSALIAVTNINAVSTTQAMDDVISRIAEFYRTGR